MFKIISESERWQYRQADIKKKKGEKSPHYIDDNKSKEYRTGTFGDRKLNTREFEDKIRANNRKATLSHYGNKLYNIFTDEQIELNKPDHKDLHKKITKRSEVKKEAAIILIEALNTLLNE